MPSFSILRRSPRGRKEQCEEQGDKGDDVKSSRATALGEDGAIGIGSKVDGDSDTKTRRGFNRELFHSIRTRLTGKSPSTPQRGIESLPQEGTAKVRSIHGTSFLSPHPVPKPQTCTYPS